MKLNPQISGVCLAAVLLLSMIAAPCAAQKAKLFSEAPTGMYEGPVKTIYTPENAPQTPKVEDLELTDTLTQYGITWKFDKKVRAGRFITGDWYFIGKATVVQITPKPLFGKEVVDHPDWTLVNKNAVREDEFKDRWARNGSVLNQPVGKSSGGFDSRLSHDLYDPSQFTKLPIDMKPGDALISTISTPDPIDYRGYGQPVNTAAILTCLQEPVPADAFRPSYADREQKIYLARNLNRGLLYSLPKVKGSPDNLSQWSRLFQRPWIDTVAWGYASPLLNMPRYGRWITHGVSRAAMLLHLDYSAEDKEPLLVHYVQYGIDNWGLVRAGHPGWRGHGGFGGGRKWPIIFAGLMLGDTDMRSPNAKYPKCNFGEDNQTALGKCYNGADVVFNSHPDWAKESPELKTLAEVYGTPMEARWRQSEGYRRCCTSVEWPAQTLAALLMRAERHWNHEAYFKYVDRWMTEDHVKMANLMKNTIEDRGDPWKYPWYMKQTNTDVFSQALWDKYRHDLPPARK